MTALVVGTLLALGALAYVLWPLIAADGRGAPPGAQPREGDEAAPMARHTAQAEAAMQGNTPAEEDPAEAEIRRARAQTRVCPTCGPRPEPGARYCSSCGAALA